MEAGTRLALGFTDRKRIARTEQKSEQRINLHERARWNQVRALVCAWQWRCEMRYVKPRALFGHPLLLFRVPFLMAIPSCKPPFLTAERSTNCTYLVFTWTIFAGRTGKQKIARSFARRSISKSWQRCREATTKSKGILQAETPPSK